MASSAISVEFKRFRSKLGLTQAAAADIFGLSSSNVVSNIETGFRKPSRLALSVMRLLNGLPIREAQRLAAQLALQKGRSR